MKTERELLSEIRDLMGEKDAFVGSAGSECTVIIDCEDADHAHKLGTALAEWSCLLSNNRDRETTPATYVKLSNTQVAKTKKIIDNIVLADYDSFDNLVGIEILVSAAEVEYYGKT